MKKSEALRILGLTDPATEDEIKKAHRKKVIENHPDQFAQDAAKHAQAEEATKRINEARDVLINRSWEPEYARAPYANPYAGRPSQQGQGAPNPYGGDPFEGWPFGQGQGQTTYVWTSWGDGASDMPFDPFDPFGFNRADRQTPEERLAEAKEGLRKEALYVGAKLVFLAACIPLGFLAQGLFIYVAASIVYGLWRRLGGCLIAFIVPIAVVGIPLLLIILPYGGVATIGLILAALIALLFDATNVNKAFKEYKAAKAAAGK